jgi:DNA-binding MarR family transcriptional regulator
MNNFVLNIIERKDLLPAEKLVLLARQLRPDATQAEIAVRTSLGTATVSRAVKVLRIRESQLAMAAAH